ncbi:endogenous retrovirus group V member 1 Env polyprotein-like [Pongo pygmaeus]|uniref:endogenous retrovirus group V member 1 Env polyprotein-like n=1 Tax=Pongo pygmaeus TaxID=9600 RepID=UPI0023E2F063|nr:endogenous retrovirus group V member 1 Env polyprotein-like [Pongo pygmaeus]
MTAQEGGAYAIIGEECCLHVNHYGQIESNLNILKDKINTLHHINEAKPFHWTDPLPEIGDWLNAVWQAIKLPWRKMPSLCQDKKITLSPGLEIVASVDLYK